MLRFEQGKIHEEYILHLYKLFEDFCRSEPKYSNRKPDFRTNNVYTRITFQTRSLPCFNEFHQLYFKDGKKVIPSNIEELLTPVPLAYWAMDDGAKLSSEFLLCTHSFLLSDVELLTKVLKSKFDLDTSVYTNKKGHSSIYIKTSSMDKFRELVSKHFHVSMKYKLEP